MEPEELTVEAVEAASGPAETWEGQCYGMACIAADLLGGGAVAVYGHYLGPVDRDGFWGDKNIGFIQHGWVVLPDGRVLDPTRWSFENVEPYIFLGDPDGEYDEGGNGFRQAMRGPPPKWRWAPDDNAAKPVSLTTVTSQADPVYMKIVWMLGGPEQVRFGANLVITTEQLFYVANTHYDHLAPVQGAIYAAFAAVGWAEAVPLDNRARAEREAAA